MILVVGDVMDDVIVRVDGPPAPGTDRAARILRQEGGSGANIACWLGHAGMAVRFAGRVGAADLARHVAALAVHGVTAVLQPDAGRPTGTVVALVGPEGERSFFTDRGANDAAPGWPAALLDGARHLHVSGHTLLAPAARADALALLAAARGRGATVSVDAGSAGWLDAHPAGDAAAMDWWPPLGTATCFANAEEAARIGAPPPGATLVATLGRDGAVLRRGGTERHVPARPTTVVDGTGAGDAFVAGFLAARGRGSDEMAGLAGGAALAAAAVARMGARPPPRPPR